MLSLVFIVGLLLGLMYTNSYAMAGAGETIKAKTALSRAFIYSGFATGILLAALLGMRTEPPVEGALHANYNQRRVLPHKKCERAELNVFVSEMKSISSIWFHFQHQLLSHK